MIYGATSLPEADYVLNMIREERIRVQQIAPIVLKCFSLSIKPFLSDKPLLLSDYVALFSTNFFHFRSTTTLILVLLTLRSFFDESFLLLHGKVFQCIFLRS